MARDFLFISHANPEDNDFTRWLALQLAQRGYPVWCDLTRLLGGEDFWRDIEGAIRTRTGKFLFVLTKASNAKAGALQELQVAHLTAGTQALHDFIIPLRLDDIPFSDLNIQIARLDTIDFRGSWARGLHQLLTKLEDEGFPKSSTFTPTLVADWWRTQFEVPCVLEGQPDRHLSNLFPIVEMPKHVHVHVMLEDEFTNPVHHSGFAFPAYCWENIVFSFASSAALKTSRAPPLPLDTTVDVPLETFVTEGARDLGIMPKEAENITLSLLRTAWDNGLNRMGPRACAIQRRNCFYYRVGGLPGDLIPFDGPGGVSGRRSLIGFKTVQEKKRYWHFAVHAEPLLTPIPAFLLVPHLVFSDDGQHPWEDADRMHRARRGQCKDWWNPEWRDRLLAMTSVLAEGDTISLPLSETTTLKVNKWPVEFTSPVSYQEPEKFEELDPDDGHEEGADDA